MVKLGAMALAIIFYARTEAYLNLTLTIILFVIELVAFVHCLMQKADAFPVVGNLSKNAWVAILGGAALVTLVCGYLSYGQDLSIFSFVAITAALVYWLDVRPALRDVADGSGGW